MPSRLVVFATELSKFIALIMRRTFNLRETLRVTVDSHVHRVFEGIQCKLTRNEKRDVDSKKSCFSRIYL